MAEWFEDLMSLDFNLVPTTGAGPPSEGSANLDEWKPSMDVIREFRQRAIRQRWRWNQLPLPSEYGALRLPDNSEIIGNKPIAGSCADVEDGGWTSQVGEGSVAPKERNCDKVKHCECNLNLAEKEDVEKSDTEEQSFYDCNICLDLAKEPVNTCCGHLFCWSCIYRWLHIHSGAKECPICKGEVTVNNVTPIYGRGSHQTHKPEEDTGFKIPNRPSARRVESSRQTMSSLPMEEMIRQLGARFENTSNFFQLPSAQGDMIGTSRALRREQASSIPLENVIDLTHDPPEVVPRHRVRSLSALVRRPDLQVIHGESQTVDTSVEDDPLWTPSASSSRRRSSRRRRVVSRGSNMDSGDSPTTRRRLNPAPRRRRLP